MGRRGCSAAERERHLPNTANAQHHRARGEIHGNAVPVRASAHRQVASGVPPDQNQPPAGKNGHQVTLSVHGVPSEVRDEGRPPTAKSPLTDKATRSDEGARNTSGLRAARWQRLIWRGCWVGGHSPPVLGPSPALTGRRVTVGAHKQCGGPGAGKTHPPDADAAVHFSAAAAVVGRHRQPPPPERCRGGGGGRIGGRRCCHWGGLESSRSHVGSLAAASRRLGAERMARNLPPPWPVRTRRLSLLFLQRCACLGGLRVQTQPFQEASLELSGHRQ